MAEAKQQPPWQTVAHSGWSRDMLEECHRREALASKTDACLACMGVRRQNARTTESSRAIKPGWDLIKHVCRASRSAARLCTLTKQVVSLVQVAPEPTAGFGAGGSVEADVMIRNGHCAIQCATSFPHVTGNSQHMNRLYCPSDSCE